LREKDFFLEIDLTVPEEYPAAKPELTIIDHNYD
jgi:hypothetical protein